MTQAKSVRYAKAVAKLRERDKEFRDRGPQRPSFLESASDLMYSFTTLSPAEVIARLEANGFVKYGGSASAFAPLLLPDNYPRFADAPVSCVYVRGGRLSFSEHVSPLVQHAVGEVKKLFKNDQRK